jgi:AraC-like DNA-binding protein
MAGAATAAASEDTTLDAWRLGSFVLSRAAPRNPSEVLDDWVLHLTTRGLRLLRGGASVTVPAGVPVVLPPGEPFEGEHGDAEGLCLFVPRDAFPEVSPALDRCCHVPLASTPGRLLGAFLQRLAAELPDMPEAEIPLAAEATRALLTAAVASGVPPGQVDEAQVQAARLARVRAILRQHIRSPELTPDRLGQLAGVSRSQLYRVFEPVGGVAREIQRERLRQAYRAIADPADGRTIREISEELGFSEPAIFSRAFRREFGHPPSRLRRALAPYPAPLDAPLAAAPAGRNLAGVPVHA